MVELDGERPAGNGAGHALGKWHRRAALQRLHYGNAVVQPVNIGGLFRFIGDFRVAEDIAIAIETHNHRDVDPGRGARGRRRLPAGAQSCDKVLDGVDPRRLGLRRRDP